MQKSILAAAITFVLLSPIAGAETTTSETTVRSSTSTTAPTSTEYEASHTEKWVDEDGTVMEKSETYNSKDPVSGESSSSTTSTVQHPDGSTHEIEQKQSIEKSGTDNTVLEKATTTTTVQ
jgi:hypothetical protein